MFGSNLTRLTTKAAAARSRLRWPRAGAVLVALLGHRGVQAALVVAVVLFSLWFMLAPLLAAVSSGTSLPPELSEASLWLDEERLRSVVASRQDRTEKPLPSLGAFAPNFGQVPVQSAPLP